MFPMAKKCWSLEDNSSQDLMINFRVIFKLQHRNWKDLPKSRNLSEDPRVGHRHKKSQLRSCGI